MTGKQESEEGEQRVEKRRENKEVMFDRGLLDYKKVDYSACYVLSI